MSSAPTPNGTAEPIRIRRATPADAGALLELKLALDADTAFMMLEPGERETVAERAAGVWSATRGQAGARSGATGTPRTS